MRAPFDQHGNLQHFPECWYEYPDGGAVVRHEPYWIDAEPFGATLIFAGFRRGRSAAYFMWRQVIPGTAQVLEYPMFMTDMADLVEFDVIEYGVVRGTTWEACKRGQNYGIRRVAR